MLISMISLAIQKGTIFDTIDSYPKNFNNSDSVMKKLVLIVTMIFLIAGITIGKETQREKRKAREKAKMEEILQLFVNRNLQFLAQSAHPMGGGVIHLTSEYTLDIQNGEVISFLPYFGVAYTADYGSNDGGIKFDEQELTSEWKSSKKGYDIQMEVKAPRDRYVLHLYISPAGYATLQVSCNNRQPISFSGIVQPIPPKEK
jgi:hypothetical protein